MDMDFIWLYVTIDNFCLEGAIDCREESMSIALFMCLPISKHAVNNRKREA